MHVHRIDLTIAVYGGTLLITRLKRSGLAASAMREGRRNRAYAVFELARLQTTMTGLDRLGRRETECAQF